MSDIAIQVENLGKAYRLGLKEDIPDTLASAAASWLRAPLSNFRRLRRLDTFVENGDEADDVIWALRDVNFNVKEGEVVGVIGRNGAGKSTLLKILSRITEPTTGRATIRGRISSLLEVGTGFHPELTGRENVYMNGTILGMAKREIDRKFDEIVDFSGVEKFLDTPVKRYSSGMKVRLAFAVAAHLEPEILIIDEVLAVGDYEFQKRCLGKMEDVAESGRTVLFVSHNMPAVRRLTKRAVFLRSGCLVGIGPTTSVINDYLQDALQEKTAGDAASVEYFRRDRSENSPVRFSRVWVEQPQSDSLPVLNSGSEVAIHFEIESSKQVESVCLTVILMKDHQDRVVTLYSPDSRSIRLEPGRQVVTCAIDSLPLSPGRYSVTAGINRSAYTRAFDVLIDMPLFEVTLPSKDSGALEWPERPWGPVHWEKVQWQMA